MVELASVRWSRKPYTGSQKISSTENTFKNTDFGNAFIPNEICLVHFRLPNHPQIIDHFEQAKKDFNSITKLKRSGSLPDLSTVPAFSGFA